MSEINTEEVLESLVKKGYAWRHKPTGEYGITKKGLNFVKELKKMEK